MSDNMQLPKNKSYTFFFDTYTQLESYSFGITTDVIYCRKKPDSWVTARTDEGKNGHFWVNILTSIAN